jgi:hypothetical protein
MGHIDRDLCCLCGEQFPEGQICNACRDSNDLAYMITTRDAATAFLDACSLEPTPDAVAQLTEAFLPCLRIMCERGYDRNGASWKEQGWRGQLYEMMKRMRRLEFFGWRRRTLHRDSAVDMINYAGFLIRSYDEMPDKPWGAFDMPDGEEQ